MPGNNPDSTSGPGLVTLYRGGVFCALEKKFFEAGFLFSKLMREWGDGVPANLTLPQGATITVDSKVYKVPQLIMRTAALFHTSAPFVMDLGDGPKEFQWNLSVDAARRLDEHVRKMHATSSTAVTQNEGKPDELRIGNSPYVSLTTDIEKAKPWTSDLVHKFDIAGNDLWQGNTLESEWLGLGGTPLTNVFRSMDRGATWKRLT